MKIVQAIRDIYKWLRCLQPIAGEGINIERTVNGSVITCTSAPVLRGGNAAVGMFTIVAETDTEGVAHVYVEDTSPAADKDADGFPIHAGIPHVNGVAFPQVKAYDGIPDAPVLYYIYLRFTPSRIKDQEEAAAGTVPDQPAQPDQPAPPDQPPCEIITSRIIMKTDLENVYHLIGRVRCARQSNRIVVSGISQDHQPAPIYITWYGPDIGVGEDTPLENLQ